MEYPQKREAVRITKPIEFEYWADSPPIQARIEDLSEKGVYVDTAHPLHVGDVISFRFSLPETPPGEPIQGRARVIWTEQTVGVGVEFVELSDEDRERIRYFVASVFFAEEKS